MKVLNLLKLTNHTLPKLEERIDKMNIKFDVLKYEIDERMDLLYCYNEKIVSARLMLEEWRKACKKVQDEFLRAYDENQRLQKLVH